MTLTRRWRMLAAAAVAASLVFAAACGSGDDDEGGDETPEATAAATAAASPTAAAETTYPLTITDMLDREVTIEAEPARIAAISPTTVEFVYAVGKTSVTRTQSVTHPPEALSATDIGSAYRANMELIAAQTPDLIVADSVLQPQLLQALEALNIPVLYIGAASFDEVLEAYRIIGEALNTPEGEAQAKVLEDKLAEIEAKVPATRVKTLIINGTPADFFAALPESYVGDLARIAGADNLAAGQPSNAPFPGYTKLSLETIVAANPEVVLAITAAPGQTITEGLSSNPAWANVPAVTNGRVTEIDTQIFLQAPGPRAAEGLDILTKLLYPEIFP